MDATVPVRLDHLAMELRYHQRPASIMGDTMRRPLPMTYHLLLHYLVLRVLSQSVP